MTESTLRILHLLSHDRIKSGGAFQAILLARAQRDRGHEVCFVHNSGRDPTEAAHAFQPLAEEGFPCRQVPMQHLGAFTGRRRFRTIVEEYRPAVIHAHRDRAARFAAEALRDRLDAALIVQKGNCYRADARTARAYCSSRVDRIIAVAEAVKRVLVLCDSVPPEKIEVVYGSFDPDRFGGQVDRAEARRQLKLGDDERSVGILANLDRKKGHGLFFSAACRVLARRARTRFVVIGGGDLQSARELAEEHGVLDATIFTGFRSDPERILPGLDVSVNCSRGGEGLTGAIRESLAVGCPVVCTNVGGNAEIVENGVSGLLVEAGDEDALAEAILRTIDCPDEASRMAAEGRRRVRALMDNEVRCSRVLGVYREVLKWRRPSLAALGLGKCLHPDAPMFSSGDAQQ